MDVASQTCRYSISSLFSLAIDYVVNNLNLYVTKNDAGLGALPSHIKNRILRRFTTSAYFWRNINFKMVLSLITNEQTLSINLTSIVLDDEILSIIQKCKRVKKLYLCGSENVFITSTALINLFSEYSNLNNLELTHVMGIDDKVLECLVDNNKHLNSIDIRGCKQVTDVGIKHISRLENLTCLNISFSQVTDDGIIALVTGPSRYKLKELWIEMTQITSTGVRAIAANCPKIEILTYSTKKTEEVTYPLFESELKHLKQLTWTVNW